MKTFHTYRLNLLNELVSCKKSMSVRINWVNTCAYTHMEIWYFQMESELIQVLLSLSKHVNITLLAQPDTACTTLLTCWHIKKELWISQKLISLPWQQCKDLNTCATYPATSLLPLQTGSGRLSTSVFCKQLCFFVGRGLLFQVKRNHTARRSSATFSQNF